MPLENAVKLERGSGVGMREPQQNKKALDESRVDAGPPRNRSCRRCGRALSNPVSLARGYGPVCWRKLGLHLARMKTLTEAFK